MHGKVVREKGFRKNEIIFKNSFFLGKYVPEPERLKSTNMWSTPAVWKQYNKMAVYTFFD